MQFTLKGGRIENGNRHSGRSRLAAVFISAVVLSLATANAGNAQELAEEASVPPVVDDAGPLIVPPQPAPVIPKHEKGFDLKGWKNLVPDLAKEQKKTWLFPFSVARGKHVKSTAI